MLQKKMEKDSDSVKVNFEKKNHFSILKSVGYFENFTIWSIAFTFLSAVMLTFANSLDPCRSKLFDTLVVLMNNFSEKVNFEKN